MENSQIRAYSLKKCCFQGTQISATKNVLLNKNGNNQAFLLQSDFVEIQNIDRVESSLLPLQQWWHHLYLYNVHNFVLVTSDISLNHVVAHVRSTKQTNNLENRKKYFRSHYTNENFHRKALKYEL